MHIPYIHQEVEKDHHEYPIPQQTKNKVLLQKWQMSGRSCGFQCNYKNHYNVWMFPRIKDSIFNSFLLIVNVVQCIWTTESKLSWPQEREWLKHFFLHFLFTFKVMYLLWCSFSFSYKYLNTILNCENIENGFWWRSISI